MRELYPRWKRRPIIPSYHALKEMGWKFDLYDVLEILENGYDCQKSARKKGTVEKCMVLKGRQARVMVVEARSDWVGGDVWLLVHAG
jgi:hypothetical protein